MPNLQSQGIDQQNYSDQVGYSGAYAEGDEVHVLNYGDITAGTDGDETTSGDGINAESTAFAKAEVDQEADQDNSNEQSADLNVDEFGISPVQYQNVNQRNDNYQDGTSIATAYSDKVEVVSEGAIER